MLLEVIGIILMILNGWAAAIYWRTSGVPLWQATLMLTAYWSFTLMLTYFGTGCIMKVLKKWSLVKTLAEKSKEIKRIYKTNPFYRKNRELVKWLSRKKGWIVFSLTFVPYVPELPTATIITARAMNLRYALPILLIGNAFRVLMLCYTVYLIF